LLYRLIYARALATIEEKRSAGWLLAPSARDGSLLDRIRRLLGVAPPVERPAGGLAGALALATVALIGVLFFLAPAANQARAGFEELDAITGTVVTAEGRPVGGADVWLVATSFPDLKGVALAKARTDAGSRIVSRCEV
jgi:hypothetical protein